MHLLRSAFDLIRYLIQHRKDVPSTSRLTSQRPR